MFIFSNLATSLDGKIATQKRELFYLGTSVDRKEMQRLRAQADVVLFGASSLRSFRKPCIVYGKAAETLRHQPANAVLSSSLDKLSVSWPFFQRTGFDRFLFVGPQAPACNLKRFEASSEVIVLKKATRRLPVALQIVNELKSRGFSRLLVEGGGQVMWEFCQENLIDEYHVTLTPRILGGTEAPTLVDGPGFRAAATLKLKLESCTRRGDELYLVYRKRRQKNSRA
ncbi:dihydrofolate reductase family protein [Bdellovibrionota bacterium FG-1]